MLARGVKQTVPHWGRHILFRLYGPLESYLGKSWKLDDILKIKRGKEPR
jgi:hypothetical protein